MKPQTRASPQSEPETHSIAGFGNDSSSRIATGVRVSSCHYRSDYRFLPRS
ncbi:hypothetical protein RBSH_04622 [Rhodopirellula baltica SH28]|uniref:Uncharacterized protein n=1 Tax=Rhodopirellula baltica SH28 TaxID=993517 RepID=K5CA53_RHOBT|nr:hypothetical protein RBSH_04622 [Rhodopirellula baltica SH28]